MCAREDYASCFWQLESLATSLDILKHWYIFLGNPTKGAGTHKRAHKWVESPHACEESPHMRERSLHTQKEDSTPRDQTLGSWVRYKVANQLSNLKFS